MNYTSLVAWSCGLLLMGCGMGAGFRNDPASNTTETIRFEFPPGSPGGGWIQKAHRKVSTKNGSGVEVLQEQRIEVNDTDVLLTQMETTIRFPGVWPAAGNMVVYQTGEWFPVRLKFPEPTMRQAGGAGRPAVSEALWYSDRLEVDGVVSKLLAGRHYVFTGDGLQESPE